MGIMSVITNIHLSKLYYGHLVTTSYSETLLSGPFLEFIQSFWCQIEMFLDLESLFNKKQSQWILVTAN